MSKRHMGYKLTTFLNVYDIRSKIALVVIFTHCNGATVWYVEHVFCGKGASGKNNETFLSVPGTPWGKLVEARSQHKP